MHIVFHELYQQVYASDPAAAPGRIECIRSELENLFTFVEPEPAGEADLGLVHSRDHIDRVKKQGLTYDVAVLAVGGALKAAELAMQKQPAFGLIRPPGHHAGPNSSWGFCYFNNVAIAVEKLRKKSLVRNALIVDIDLHYGDGTANFFELAHDVVYYHVAGNDRQSFLTSLKRFMETQKDYDVIAVSAGFDRHELDWGAQLRTEDYTVIGRTIKEHAKEKCGGKAFAVLEGGYNNSVLGENVKAFVLGLNS